MMAAYPPDTYDERADLKAYYLLEEHMHALETEQAEKESIIEESLLASEAAA